MVMTGGDYLRLIEKLERKNAALKAMVAHMAIRLDKDAEAFKMLINEVHPSRGLDEVVSEIKQTLSKIPAQCLADVKADAIIKAANGCSYEVEEGGLCHDR